MPLGVGVLFWTREMPPSLLDPLAVGRIVDPTFPKVQRRVDQWLRCRRAVPRSFNQKESLEIALHYRTIIELISATTTKSGLKIKAERDWNHYETGVQVSKAELAALPLFRHEFHGDWNYTLAPAQNA
jgi:hypothetical protein